MNSTQTTVGDKAGAIPWWTDLEPAMAHAREAQRPLYIDVWAPG
jgi:hypothetical protein